MECLHSGTTQVVLTGRVIDGHLWFLFYIMDSNNLGDLYSKILVKEESLRMLKHQVEMTKYDILCEKKTIALYQHVLKNDKVYLAAKNAKNIS